MDYKAGSSVRSWRAFGRPIDGFSVRLSARDRPGGVPFMDVRAVDGKKRELYRSVTMPLRSTVMVMLLTRILKPSGGVTELQLRVKGL